METVVETSSNLLESEQTYTEKEKIDKINYFFIIIRVFLYFIMGVLKKYIIIKMADFHF
jgi:hypothetical protein